MTRFLFQITRFILIFVCYSQAPTRKDSVCSSLSTSRAPSATSYVSSTALSHTLENGDTSISHETTKVIY